MASAGTAYVLVKGDFGPLRAGLRHSERSMGDSLGRMESRAQRASRRIGQVAKVGGIALAAGLGVAAKRAFSEFEESERVTRQTRAVLKSTGDAAGVTAKEIEGLAKQLSLKAGVDDEAIQSAENLLLTFTGVKNEVGDGNDIFSQATEVITDMSAALDQDLRSSTLQVGKALQDPIKGITALRRVGVNFNKEQTETVKKMVESGRTMDAQKFILRELRTEFEGSAEAQATASDKLRVSLNNVLESIGRGFAPALEDAAKSASKFFDDVNAVFENKELTADEKFDRIGDLIAQRIEKALPVIGEAAAKIGPRIAEAMLRGFLNAPPLVQLFAGAWLVARSRRLLAAFGLLGTQAGAAFGTGVGTGAAGGAGAGAAAGGLAGLAGRMKLFATRAGFIGVGVAAGSEIFKGLEREIDKSSKQVNERLSAIAEGNFADQFAGNIEGFFDTSGLPSVSKLFESDDQRVAEDLKTIIEDIVKHGKSISAETDKAARGWLRQLELTREQRSEIRQILDLGASRGGGAAGLPIVEQLKNTKRLTPAVINEITAEIDKLPKSAQRSAATLVLGMARELKRKGQLRGSVQELRNVISAEVDGIGSLSLGGPRRMRRGIEALFAQLPGVVENPTSKMAGIVQTYLDAFGLAGADKIGTAISHAKALNKSYKFKRDPGQAGFAGGGFLQGVGRKDTVPVMAAPGEAILNRHQQAPVETALRTTYGYGLQDLFKKERRPHYMAKGGFVDNYARGGIVTGDLDMGRALLRALEQMARGTGRSISVQSGGRSIGEQERLYARYLAGGNLAAKPSPNAPHVRGIAADISPGRDVFGGVAGRYGLGFTVPSEPWHIEILSGKGGGAADTSVEVPTLPTVRVTGRETVAKALARRSIDRVKEAARRFLDKQSVSVDPSEDGGRGVDFGNVKGSGADLMRQISKQQGWSFADWWEIDRRESAHGTNLVNPTSTARLRGQFLDFNWGKYGPGSDPRQNPSMREQILSMAQYIKERYGNPTRALAKHNLSNWYAKGGFVEHLFASAGKPPGVPEATTTRKKPEPPKGLKTPRRNALQRHRLAKKIVGKGRRRKPITLPPEFNLRQLDFLNVAIDKTIPGIQERISSLDQQFSLTDPDFYPDDRALTRLRNAGHNIQRFGTGDSAQYIDWTAVGEKKNQLSTLLGESYKLIATPFGAQPMGLMESVKLAFPPLMEGVTRLVKRLEDQITEIKRKVRENIRRMKVLDERIEKERKKKEKDRDEDKIKKWDDEREKLGTETRRLTGQRRPESVQDIQAGSDSGRLGDLLDKQEKAQQALTDLEEDKQSFIGISGEAGDYGTQKIDIQRLVNELGELSTDRIKEAIDTPKDEKNRDAQNFLVNIAELFKQYGSNFQRIIPTFATGGTVPGPIGKPRIIEAHGREEVLSEKQLKELRKVLELAAKNDDGRPSRIVNQTIQFQTQPRDFHTFARSALVEEQQV